MRKGLTNSDSEGHPLTPGTSLIPSYCCAVHTRGEKRTVIYSRGKRKKSCIKCRSNLGVHEENSGRVNIDLSGVDYD